MTHASSHSHQPSPGSRLSLALFITLGFVVIEALAGWWANSLALLTDAVHNLTDVAALALTWYTLRLAFRPANARKTFGYHRAGILAALANSATLVVIAVGICLEAYRRWQNPLPVDAGVLTGVGLVALLVNAGTAWLVHRGSQHDLNLRSAFLHLMGDVISTLGAILAGIVILFTGWNWLDPLVSVLIGMLILLSAWSILREALDVLLEATPHDIRLEQLLADLQALPGLQNVHDLHVWSINQGTRLLSAHVVIDNMSLSDSAAIRAEIARLLHTRYGISHTTLQVECANCAASDLYCDLALKHNGD